ncbi:MAG: hypothetical protein K2Y28_14345 [Burkholderiaceae bacterium]|nr:hypothetical protein [Burkholderiaceae bacterium]
MVSIGRYLRNEASYKPDAYAVLKQHFSGKRAFEQFYAAIPESRRNDFLRVCVSYRYLAKHGDWKINVHGVNSVVDYITNSYKLVAVFSLIESLSDLDHLDFYQWLIAKKQKLSFPIEDRRTLDVRYQEYKVSYGAIRRCERFFLSLPLEEQRSLCGSVTLNKKPSAEIKKLAGYLYQLRSKFVHNGELVLELGGPLYVVTKKGLVHSSLTVAAIFRAFELGLLAHFNGEPN